MPLGGLEGNIIRKCRKCRRPPGLFFFAFFFNEVRLHGLVTEGLLGRARQSCCPKVPDHVKANVKQVIEGKAAPEVLKTQGDAVATMGTKVKMASAGMAMYQGSVIQGFRSGQTNEINLTIASFFHSCNIPAHNANAPVFREMVQAIKMAPATYYPPPPQ
jgi:hypothetical protein